MKAVSPSRRMISPISRSLPTRTMSYMRAPVMPGAMTAGPAILMSPPVIATAALLLLPPSRPRRPLGARRAQGPPELHVEPNVLRDQAGDVVLAGFDLRLRRGKRHHDRHLPPAHEARQILVQTLQQRFVDRGQAVVQRGQLPQVLERLLGRRGFAHLHAGQPEARRHLRIRDHGHPIHVPSPFARGAGVSYTTTISRRTRSRGMPSILLRAMRRRFTTSLYFSAR